MPSDTFPLRLRLDGDALAANWRLMAALAGPGGCGAAVKADAYGLGAREATARLAAAGARDFFVATWAEAGALGPLPAGIALSVLHGVREGDRAAALASPARPVLNSPDQVRRWRETGRPCDVMVDTGMNRLGLTVQEAGSGLLDGLPIETLMSHLACADEPGHPLNEAQRTGFAAVCARVPARRTSLANSAGIWLGAPYRLDLVRPGLALYGGVPVAAAGGIRPVATIEAEVLQLRRIEAGASVGYGATFTAPAAMDVAILNIGYADGYLRAFAGGGTITVAGERRAVLGRVSMDLIAVDARSTGIGEGDFVGVDYDLPAAAAITGLSQYELLTGLGRRYQRSWT